MNRTSFRLQRQPLAELLLNEDSVLVSLDSRDTMSAYQEVFSHLPDVFSYIHDV